MEPEEPDEDATPVQPPPPPAAPPRPEIRIVDASRRRASRGCVSCGRPKPPHVQVEVDGVIEYTCKDCYDLQSQGISPKIAGYCPKCGTPLLLGDHFCGKCGAPALLRCPSCGTASEEEDVFCGSCGTRLRAP